MGGTYWQGQSQESAVCLSGQPAGEWAVALRAERVPGTTLTIGRCTCVQLRQLKNPSNYLLCANSKVSLGR